MLKISCVTACLAPRDVVVKVVMVILVKIDFRGMNIVSQRAWHRVMSKQHFHVMEAIRKMEPEWVKVNGRNFALVEYKDAKGELRPCYQLTKTECLYIAMSQRAWHRVT